MKLFKLENYRKSTPKHGIIVFDESCLKSTLIFKLV